MEIFEKNFSDLVNMIVPEDINNLGSLRGYVCFTKKDLIKKIEKELIEKYHIKIISLLKNCINKNENDLKIPDKIWKDIGYYLKNTKSLN